MNRRKKPVQSPSTNNHQAPLPGETTAILLRRSPARFDDVALGRSSLKIDIVGFLERILLVLRVTSARLRRLGELAGVFVGRRGFLADAGVCRSVHLCREDACEAEVEVEVEVI